MGGIKVTADAKEKMIPKITVGHTSLQIPHYQCLGALRLSILHITLNYKNKEGEVQYYLSDA